LDKKTEDKNIWQLSNVPQRKYIQQTIEQVENKMSVQSLIYPFSLQLAFDKRFHSADIVHYHLIHTGFFSILSLPLLSHLKPTIWTLHDPWL